MYFEILLKVLHEGRNAGSDFNWLKKVGRLYQNVEKH